MAHLERWGVSMSCEERDIWLVDGGEKGGRNLLRQGLGFSRPSLRKGGLVLSGGRGRGRWGSPRMGLRRLGLRGWPCGRIRCGR